MFARFRNLFSKSKSDEELQAAMEYCSDLQETLLQNGNTLEEAESKCNEPSDKTVDSAIAHDNTNKTIENQILDAINSMDQDKTENNTCDSLKPLNANVNVAHTNCNNSSVTVEDIATPSDSGNSSNESTLSAGTSTASTANTITVNPAGNNGLACAAITNKLNDIAEVAESLDEVIRHIQSDADVLESNSSTTSEKKHDNAGSILSEVSAYFDVDNRLFNISCFGSKRIKV